MSIHLSFSKDTRGWRSTFRARASGTADSLYFRTVRSVFRFRNHLRPFPLPQGTARPAGLCPMPHGRSGQSSCRGRSIESRRASRRPGASRRIWVCWARPHPQATVEWSGHPDGGSGPEWRNGRRGGLKHRWEYAPVWVRVPPPAPPASVAKKLPAPVRHDARRSLYPNAVCIDGPVTERSWPPGTRTFARLVWQRVRPTPGRVGLCSC